MSAEGWAWLTLGVFSAWFVVHMFVGFYYGLAVSWAHNILTSLGAAVQYTLITAAVCALAAVLVAGARVLWL